MKNKFEKKYKDLLKKCISKKAKTSNRTGVDTYKLFNQTLNINLSKGFPIITGKKIFFDKALAEFNWIYNGQTDLKYLHDNNIYWWDDFVMKDNTLGKVYGHQIRKFNSNFDQIKYCINEIKNNSRRAVITLWNPSELKDQALPCCYTQFNFVRINDKLNMSMSFRSSDMFLGLPYDIIVGALLLIKISKETKLIPNMLGLNLADAHIYVSHLPQIKKYLNSKIYRLPALLPENKLINYQSNKYIKTKIVL
tara:strand:- start:33 stop:785 length:753 start_codon:yes stop_codon:yes gene_type:complete